MTRASGAGLGFAIGALNVIVVAIVIGCLHEREPGGVIVFVGLYGGIPGVVVGTILGAIAARIGQQARLVRAAVLAAPAFGLVFALGRLFGVPEMIGPASIPTVFAVWLLEYATRARPDEPVPGARVV